MKNKIIAGVLTVVIAVFIIGTLYALIKSLLAIVGLFYLISLAVNMWSKTKEPDETPSAYPRTPRTKPRPRH